VHPNEAGARRFADAILRGYMEKLRWEFRGQRTGTRCGFEIDDRQVWVD